MESVREGYGSVREGHGLHSHQPKSVPEAYGCYSHHPKSVRGQYGSVSVGYMKYGRLHVKATLGC